MNRIDKLRLDTARDAIPVICPVRNERELIPHFVSHYRAQGVRQFVFIDNVSDDGTTEFLLEQDDCVVFQTAASYADANFAVDWVNQLVEAHFRDRWVMHVDCDEHVVLPSVGEENLSSFARRLAEEGADTAYAAMLDTYPATDFRTVRIRADDQIHDKLGYFDGGYLFREFPQRFWEERAPKFRLEVLGGPKWRIMKQLDMRRPTGAFHDTCFNVLSRFADLAPRSAIPRLATIFPVHRPAQHKQPLNFAHGNMAWTNSHTTTNNRLSRYNIALLHLKFSANLAKRFQQSQNEGQHYLRGLPDEQLRSALLAWPRDSLLYEGSQKFSGSAQLEQMGLIGDTVSRLWRLKGQKRVWTTLDASRPADPYSAVSLNPPGSSNLSVT